MCTQLTVLLSLLPLWRLAVTGEFATMIHGESSGIGWTIRGLCCTEIYGGTGMSVMIFLLECAIALH
jgi:hypothetical protein